jgi:endonuclease/exonuclease/phosphatase family metal-dependent hydrolase
LPPDLELPIHVGCVHLGLREAHRQAQLKMLAEWANALPDGEPVVVAGDFNDWRQRANHPLKVDAGLEEILPAPMAPGAHLSGPFSAAAP